MIEIPSRDHPLVSVLLPVRDAGEHLHECLASLARQTLGEHEVVAVDDGSTDGSGEVLARAAAHDPRLRVVRQRPRGLVAALDAALAEARAPYIARMDADDVCHPRRLEMQLRLLQDRPEIGVASCLVRIFPRSGVGEGYRLYESWLNALVTPQQIARERFVESPLAHPSVMLRRNLLDEVGGYREVGWPEDYDLWLRLLEAGVAFAKVERHLLFWREHGQRLTRRHDRYAVDRFLACKAHYLARGPVGAGRRVVVWGAGETGRRLSRYLLGESANLVAFVDIDSAKIGRTVRGAPVIAYEELPDFMRIGAVVLAAVASRGARELIRDRLDAIGLVEGRDFWCVA